LPILNPDFVLQANLGQAVTVDEFDVRPLGLLGRASREGPRGDENAVGRPIAAPYTFQLLDLGASDSVLPSLDLDRPRKVP
jgi:hypothetical protein